MFTSNSTFIFESFDFDAVTKTARFVYRLESDDQSSAEAVECIEELQFETPGVRGASDSAAFKQILFDLHIALGMSYWKTACSKQLVVKSGALSAQDAEFWNTIYTKGLGEFFYHNSIDFHDLVQFPVTAIDDEVSVRPEIVSIQKGTQPNTVVPLGGGKDSLTTVGLLERAHIPFETVSLGSYPLIEQQVAKIGRPHHRIIRTIDPQLFEMNRSGAFNGHVPISVIYAFTSVAVAVLNGHSSVVLSNERSANYGNVQYLGADINHQWSKSVEFEQLLQMHLADHQVPVQYFSLLRPLYEFQITTLFIQDIEKWSGLFSSCNRNFTQSVNGTSQVTKSTNAYWCGVCPKCVFVATLLAAHVPKDQLINIIGGNPLDNPENEEVFLELLGISAFKPFECVGTPNEMIIALETLSVHPDYAQSTLLQVYNRVHAELDVETALQDTHAFGDSALLPEQFAVVRETMQQSIV